MPIAILGLLVTISSIVKFADTGEVSASLDTQVNGIFGFVVALWAAIFLESWKRKQRTIQYLWNCSESAFSRADERTEEFSYYTIYNEITDQLEKRKKLTGALNKTLRDVTSWIFIIVVLVAMGVYQVMIDKTKGKWENGI